MTRVSYFQRYSQRENHVTNNTLLVLRHLYETSPAKLEGVLRMVLGDGQLRLGPAFQQQVRGVASVPDAVVTQAAFSLYVEAKLGGALDAGQIEKHIVSIAAHASPDAGQRFLIGLTTMPLAPQDEARLGSVAKAEGIVFRSVTYLALVEALQGVCADYEVSLQAIVDDYVDFIQGEKLLYTPDDWLLGFACGVSYEENRRFALYYCDPSRPRRQECRFMGIYRDKMISLIGEIAAVIVCGYEDGKVKVIKIEQGPTETWMIERVKEVIEATDQYDLRSNPQRYYLAERLVSTDFRKASFGGLREVQRIRLQDAVGPLVKVRDLDLDAVAERLRGKTF